MGGHLAIGAVDLGVVEAGLDHRDLGVVWNQQPGRPTEEGEGPHMGVDPVGQGLGPAGVGEAEARSAHHRHEHMRRPRLAGAAVDDHRHGVAGVVDEQLVAAQVGLAHGFTAAFFQLPVELAEAAVAVALGVGLDVFVPQDLQRDVLALHLPVQRRPVGLRPTAMAAPGARLAVEPGLQIGVRQVQR